MKKLTGVLVAVFACLAPLARAQGFIVPNGVTQAAYGDIYSFHVLQNPTNGNYTDFVFVPQNATSFLLGTAGDEGIRLFSVSSGDPVSLQAINAAVYPELAYPNTYVFDVGIPFYLGLFTGDEYPQNGIYPTPLYGWAHLVNNGGTIELLDSALTFGADGIYAGTQTIIQPVPEPGAFSLIGLGLLGLGWHFRRRSSL